MRIALSWPHKLLWPNGSRGNHFSVSGAKKAAKNEASWLAIQYRNANGLMQSGWRLLQQPSADIYRSLKAAWQTDASAANLAMWNRGEICPPDFVRLADGIRSAVDERFFNAFGNAVVPQIPELIGNAILQAIASQEKAA